MTAMGEVWRQSMAGKWHLISSVDSNFPYCNDRPISGSKRLVGEAHDIAGHNVCKKCLKEYSRRMEHSSRS